MRITPYSNPLYKYIVRKQSYSYISSLSAGPPNSI